MNDDQLTFTLGDIDFFTRDLRKSDKGDHYIGRDYTTGKDYGLMWENGAFRFKKSSDGVQKMEMGGFASMAPQIAGTVANIAAPGLGSLVEPIWQAVSQSMDARIGKLTLTPGKTTFGNGGSLTPGGSTGVGYYSGKSHRIGGIRVTPNGTPSKFPTDQEVEGDETMVEFRELGTHIFSKRLKV